MPKRMNSPSMADTGKVGYSQISIADASRLAFVSGQVAWRAKGGAADDPVGNQIELYVQLTA